MGDKAADDKRKEEEDHRSRSREEIIKTDDADATKWDCGSPLYDCYELVSVSYIIERHLMSLPILDGYRSPQTVALSSDMKLMRPCRKVPGYSIMDSLVQLLRRNKTKKKNLDKEDDKMQKCGVWFI